MLRLLATLLLLCIICVWPRPAASAEVLTLEVGDRPREFLLYRARPADARSPVLIAFHGRGDTARNFARTSRLHRAWREAHVLYPQGLELAQERSLRGWGRAGSDPNQDLRFVDAVLETLPSLLGTAYGARFAAGFSNGGRFVFTLMDTHADAFAGFAAVGAVAPGMANAGEAAARVPAPVIYLFGEYESRDYQSAWEATVVGLARRNLATGETRPWADELTRFEHARGGAPTVYGLYRAGHVWPAAGSRQIARFFRSLPPAP